MEVFGQSTGFAYPFFPDKLVDNFNIVFFSRRLLSSARFVGSGEFCQLAFSGSIWAIFLETLRFLGGWLFKA